MIEPKIETALKNFFQSEKILQLRELAFKRSGFSGWKKNWIRSFAPSKLRTEKFPPALVQMMSLLRRLYEKQQDWLLIIIQRMESSLCSNSHRK